MGGPRPNAYVTWLSPLLGLEQLRAARSQGAAHLARRRARTRRGAAARTPRAGARDASGGAAATEFNPNPSPNLSSSPNSNPNPNPKPSPNPVSNQAPALRRWREMAAEGVARRRIIGRLSRPEARALGSWRAYAAARGDATRKLRWAITLWPRAGAKGYRALTLTSIWSSQTLTPPSYHPFPGGRHRRCGAHRWRAPLRGGARSARRARRGRGAAARRRLGGRTPELALTPTLTP